MQMKRFFEYQMGRVIAFSIVVIIVGGFLSYIVWNGYSSQLKARNSVKKLFAGEVSRRAIAVGSFFSERVADLELVAAGGITASVLGDTRIASELGMEDLYEKDSIILYEGLSNLISRRMVKGESVFRRIAVMERSGRVMVDTDSEPPPYDESFSLKQLGALPEKPVFRTSEIGGDLSIVISVQVVSTVGSLGSVVGWVSVPSVSARISEIFANSGLGTDFLMMDGTILALSGRAAMLGSQLLGFMNSIEGWQGMTTVNFKADGKAKRYTLFSTPVPGTPFSLVSLVPADNLLGTINPERSLYYSLSMLAAIFLASFYFIKTIVTKSVLQTRIHETRRREYEVEQQRKLLEQEILERRMAENLRIRAETRYREIFDNASIGIFQITLDGRFVTANDALAYIYGYSDAKELTASVNSVPDQLYVDRTDWDDTISELRDVGRITGMECRVRKKDGSIIWTSRDMRIVHYEPGGSGYVEGFVLDINKRRVAEKQLAESEKRFRSLFRNSPVSLWELDGSRIKARLDEVVEDSGYDIERYLDEHPEEIGAIVSRLKVKDVNDATLGLFGSSSKEQLLSFGLAQYVNPQSMGFYRDLLLKIAHGVRFHKGEVQHYPPHGGSRHFIVQWSVVPGFEDSLGQVLATVEDITEIKHFEKELKQARDEAQRANEAKGSFLANMTHEFRTPMNAIIGLAQLMDTGELDDWQRENLRLIRTSANSLLVIVNDILDLSKVDSGYLELHPEPLSLMRLLNDVLELVRVPAEQNGVSLRLDAQDVPQKVVADGVRLRQVMLNLLSNAVKFSEDGEVLFRVRANGVERTDSMTEVVFEVIDNGIGLPEESLETIFDSFVQADGSITRKFGGTGLGLAICQRLVRLMDGEIRAENNSGGGAAFIVSLPLQICADDVQEKNVPLKKENGKPDLSALRVLVAEDSRMNRLVLQKIFIKHGIEHARFAENGQEALELASGEDYDVILMDIQMPVMDGFTATREIRKLNRDVAIMALTANAQESYAQACLDSGMDGVISKPVDIDELIGVFSRISLGLPEN